MLKLIPLTIIAALITTTTFATEPTKFHETFDGKTRPKNWGVNFGHWEPQDGHLVVRQLDKDKHAAASRWRIPLSDASITARVNLGDASAFHIGFDPKPGTIKKKGHLYSLVITHKQAMLKKHKDKSDPKSQDETLASAGYDPLTDWFDVELATIGNTVTARIGKNVKLEATDASFHVAKPTIVFRVIGGDVKIDDIKVDVRKP